MLVISFMAPHTRRRNAFVLVGNMTRNALHFCVTSQQFELGILVVIKPNVFPSAGRADSVTRLTLRPQTALVNIILPMTAVASFWRFTIFFVRGVTAFALHRFVRTVQSVFRQTVVLEARFVELDDVGRAAFMIGVAGAASGTLLLTMHASLLLQIDVDIFVAIDAQTILRVLVEWQVATLALFLNLRMATNHLPGHQRRF